MSEELRNALNALLYQTGTQSYSFMMVLATNRAEDLDSAVLDRMDESLYFGLPAPEHRARLVGQYFDTYVDAHTARARRGREGWANPRRALRWCLGQGSALADLGLPPPLRVAFDEEGGAGGAPTPPAPTRTGDRARDAEARRAHRAALVEHAAAAERAEEAAKRRVLTEVSARLEGFSGREISKLMVALQSVRFWREQRQHRSSRTLL